MKTFASAKEKGEWVCKGAPLKLWIRRLDTRHFALLNWHSKLAKAVNDYRIEVKR